MKRENEADRVQNQSEKQAKSNHIKRTFSHSSQLFIYFIFYFSSSLLFLIAQHLFCWFQCLLLFRNYYCLPWTIQRIKIIIYKQQDYESNWRNFLIAIVTSWNEMMDGHAFVVCSKSFHVLGTHTGTVPNVIRIFFVFWCHSSIAPTEHSSRRNIILQIYSDWNMKFII